MRGDAMPRMRSRRGQSRSISTHRLPHRSWEQKLCQQQRKGDGRCARRYDAHCARPQRPILQLELRLKDYFVVWWLSAAARCQRCETAAAGPQIHSICEWLRAES